MDNCIVCLEFNPDQFFRISIKTSEWKESNMQRIIEKHLWWWHLKKRRKGAVQWICRQCWQEISTFHQFYCKVENGHKQYELMTSFVKSDIEVESEIKNEDLTEEELKLFECETILNEDDVLPTRKRKPGRKCKLSTKEDIKSVDYGTSLNEELMPLEKRKRSKKDKGAFIQIEELPVVEVKSEINTGDNLKKYKEENESQSDNEVSNLFDSESLNDVWEPKSDNESSDTDNGNDDYNAIDSNGDDISNKSTNSNEQNKTATRKRKKRPRKPKTIERVESIRKENEFLAENNFQFFCNICKAETTDFQKLETHFRIEHQMKGYAMCCEAKMFKRSEIVDHIHIHSDPNYFKCQFCDKVLATRKTLVNHINCIHNAEQSNKYKCDKCDKSYARKYLYERHCLTIHLPDEKKQFQCTECNKRFPTQQILNHHVTRTHVKKYHKFCEICGKLLRNQYVMDRHMAEHSGAPQAKIPCDICGLELSNKYRLNRHKKMIHVEENLKEIVCPFCPKVSHSLNAHQHHVFNVHTTKRIHACHLCDKKFKRPMELKEHISTHTGEFLYTCPHCPKQFRNAANMHKHRKQNHRKEWEESRMKRFPHLKLDALTNRETGNICDSTNSALMMQSFAD